MAVTQKQIAQLLSLSQPQVAQALNGQPGVSEATRQRVLEAAKSLGYNLNSNGGARRLAALRYGKSLKTGTVAVLMGDFFEGLPLPQLPFFREILQGLHQEIERFDSHAATYYISRAGRLPDAVLSGNVDGVICIYSPTIEWELDIAHLDVPVVRLGGATTNWHLRPDGYQGIYEVTRHLIELGHRRIAFLGDLERKFAIFAHDERLRGFHSAMDEAGLEIDDTLLLHLEEPSSQDGFAVMQKAFERGLEFSAVVCLNDLSALGALNAAEQYGLQVPRDLSITGFDGLQWEHSPSVELTSVFFNRELMGRKAVRMIYEAPASPQSANQEPAREILPVQLLIKHTTASAPEAEKVLLA
jgi:LacI family transcriptional regulator